MEMRGGDLNGWDSLAHIELMSNIEEEFGVRFDALQIMRFQNINEIVNFIIEKMQNG